MYSVSEAYSEAIAKQSRRFRLSGDILLQSRTKIDITDRNVLGDMNIEAVMMSGSSSEDIIDIGAVVSSKLTMTLHDGSASDSFADALVRPIVGLQTTADVYEDIPMGIFYVNAASIKRVRNQISFIAYDKMILMNFILTEDMRATISQMLPYGATAYLCALVGIPMAQAQATVDAFPNGDITLSGATDKRIETARDLIMWCAQMMGCFARIDRYGRLEYVQIKAENDADTGMIIPVREIAAKQRTSTRFADGVLRISSLIMKKSDGILTRAYLSVTSTTKRSVELELEQNPLLIGEETRTVAAALKAILTVLKTAYFRPFSASVANDPALDAGDYVRLLGGNIDTSRGYATGMITHSCWHYSGAQDIVNVGAVPVISQLEDTAAIAEVAEISEVTEGEGSGDVSGNEVVYTQPRKQSEKLAGSGSGGGADTIENAIIIQQKDITHLLHEYTIIKYFAGNKAVYAGPANQIIVGQRVFVSNKTFDKAAAPMYAGTVEFSRGWYSNNAQTLTFKPQLTGYNINYTPPMKNVKFVMEGSMLSAPVSATTSTQGDYGFTFVYNSIVAPDGVADDLKEAFPYGYVTANAYRVAAASTGYGSASMAAIYVGFVSVEEFNAAVGLTYEPEYKDEVNETITVVPDSEITSGEELLQLAYAYTDNAVQNHESSVNAAIDAVYDSIAQTNSSVRANAAQIALNTSAIDAINDPDSGILAQSMLYTDTKTS